MIAKLGETIEPSSRNKQHEYERKLKEKLEKLVASCQVPPWSNNQTNSGLESRYQHMVAVGKLHHNSIYCMSDIISQFKMIETSTKNILVKGSSLELMIIRAAFLKVWIVQHSVLFQPTVLAGSIPLTCWHIYRYLLIRNSMLLASEYSVDWAILYRFAWLNLYFSKMAVYQLSSLAKSIRLKIFSELAWTNHGFKNWKRL